jgi:hypothetical protein
MPHHSLRAGQIHGIASCNGWHIACSSKQQAHHKTLAQGRKCDKPMSKRSHRDPFATIDPQQLANFGGGASRVTARNSGNDQLTTMLSTITQSIQQLASGNSQQQDPMQQMMMMMMMGGMGGGGGGTVAAPQSAPAAPQAPPVINITTSVRPRGW